MPFLIGAAIGGGVGLFLGGQADDALEGGGGLNYTTLAVYALAGAGAVWLWRRVS